MTGTSVCSWRTGDYTIIVCVRAGHILLVWQRNVTGTERHGVFAERQPSTLID